jgi:hypothetical protein
MTRQSKKVKLRKRRQAILKKVKVEKEVLGVRETTLNAHHNSGVETNNPIVLDFYKALKNQKVFGSFCSLFKMRGLNADEKKSALRTHELSYVGDIAIRPFESDFMKRVQIIRKMIYSNNYDHSKSLSIMTIPKALGYYAKEYFKDKEYPIKHSLLYYQFVFGTASVIIGLFMIFGLIYYFWGGLVLGILLIATFIYSCIGIYKLCNINLF